MINDWGVEKMDQSVFGDYELRYRAALNFSVR